MELAAATPLDGHDYSNFRTAVGKLIFMAPWRLDMQTCPVSRNMEQARSETVDTISQRHATHLSRLEPRELVQTGLRELVGSSDLNWAGDLREIIAMYTT